MHKECTYVRNILCLLFLPEILSEIRRKSEKIVGTFFSEHFEHVRINNVRTFWKLM